MSEPNSGPPKAWIWFAIGTGVTFIGGIAVSLLLAQTGKPEGLPLKSIIFAVNLLAVVFAAATAILFNRDRRS